MAILHAGRGLSTFSVARLAGRSRLRPGSASSRLVDATRLLAPQEHPQVDQVGQDDGGGEGAADVGG